MRNRNLLSTLSFLLCFSLLLFSCKDNPSLIKDEPPELPSASSMRLDFSNFESQQKTNGTQTESNDNFSRAVGTAVIMKAVVDINLAIPRILLAAASNTEAELNEDEKWEWNYSKTAGDNDYGVRLVASREGEDAVSWGFYVTNSEMELDDQLFFSGATNANGTAGSWFYYSLQNTESQEQVSVINWSVNGEDDVSLRLEVTSDRNDNQGDYIEYSFDGTIKNAVYYDSSENKETEIELNVDTKEGFIIAPNYNNGVKACWDSNYEDVVCS